MKTHALVVIALGIAFGACAESDDDETGVDAQTDTADPGDPAMSPEALTDPFSPVATPTLAPSSGTTYYATPSTLSTVLSHATAGSTIILQPGSYGALTWPAGKNGTATAPITLEAQTSAVTI